MVGVPHPKAHDRHGVVRADDLDANQCDGACQRNSDFNFGNMAPRAEDQLFVIDYRPASGEFVFR
jgi:hypothetical protein